MVSLQVDKAPVDFAEEGSVEAVEDGDNGVGAGDGLAHAEDGSVGLERVGAEAVEE